jgi:hypothetical protein
LFFNCLLLIRCLYGKCSGFSTTKAMFSVKLCYLHELF